MNGRGDERRSCSEHGVPYIGRTCVFDAKHSDFELIFPDPVHEFDTSDDDRGSSEPLQAKHWAQAKLDRAMILFNDDLPFEMAASEEFFNTQHMDAGPRLSAFAREYAPLPLFAPEPGRLRGDPGPCSASRRMDGRQRADGVACSACGRQSWMMLGGWLNAVACVLKKRIRHLLFQPISQPRFDPVSSLMRPANPELGHRLEPASIPTVNQPRTGKTPMSGFQFQRKLIERCDNASRRP